MVHFLERGTPRFFLFACFASLLYLSQVSLSVAPRQASGSASLASRPRARSQREVGDPCVFVTQCGSDGLGHQLEARLSLLALSIAMGEARWVNGSTDRLLEIRSPLVVRAMERVHTSCSEGSPISECFTWTGKVGPPDGDDAGSCVSAASRAGTAVPFAAHLTTDEASLVVQRLLAPISDRIVYPAADGVEHGTVDYDAKRLDELTDLRLARASLGLPPTATRDTPSMCSAEHLEVVDNAFVSAYRFHSFAWRVAQPFLRQLYRDVLPIDVSLHEPKVVMHIRRGDAWGRATPMTFFVDAAQLAFDLIESRRTRANLPAKQPCIHVHTDATGRALAKVTDPLDALKADANVTIVPASTLPDVVLTDFLSANVFIGSFSSLSFAAAHLANPTEQDLIFHRDDFTRTQFDALRVLEDDNIILL